MDACICAMVRIGRVFLILAGMAYSGSSTALVLTWPVPASTTTQPTQGYGHFSDVVAGRHHVGVDVGRSGVTSPLDVVAAASGTVERVVLLSQNGNQTRCLGNVVVLRHGSQYTHYAHLASDIPVQPGATVSAGQRIGTMSNTTGNTAGGTACTSVGIHLHFEVKNHRWLGIGPDSDAQGPYGYTDAHPDSLGFFDPIQMLPGVSVISPVQTATVTTDGAGITPRLGPGTNFNYLTNFSIASGQQYSAVAQQGATTGCGLGWVQVRRINGSYFPGANFHGGSGSEIREIWLCRGNAGQTWVQLGASGQTYSLTVGRSGTGSGTVTSNPSGINCGSTCSASFASGTNVTLTPAAASGSTFAGWSGACTGTGTCTVAMSQARSVTATFNTTAPTTYTLSVTQSGTGSGTVTSNPGGINCGSTCSASFASGTNVTLTPTAAAGSTFAGWSGACTGTGTCTVSMSQARSVTATFNTVAPTTYTLSVTRSGTGSGTVTSNPSGINCGSTCSVSFASGTNVTLTPTAASGSEFAGWSGACTGTGSCTVSMSQARSVTAIFNTTAPNTYTLSVTRSGTGSGTVTSNPSGINCGSTCSASFASGTNVTLTPTAASGSTFAGWSGACAGTGACTVSMSQARSVAAAFNSNGSSPVALQNLVPINGSVNSTVQNGDFRDYTATIPSGMVELAFFLSNISADADLYVKYGSPPTLDSYDCRPFRNGVENETCNFSNPTQGTWYVRVYGWATGPQTYTILAGWFTSLTVSKTGAGEGTVISSPAGIDCGATCTYPFRPTELVQLIAIASSGSTFGGMTGCGSYALNTCIVSMEQSRTVTVTFNTAAPTTYTLSVTRSGTGSGTVSSNPSGINCGSTCSASFESGTNVTLTPTAASGSTFSGWSGACTGTGTCTVAMSQARSATATFNSSTPGNNTLSVTRAGAGTGSVTSSPGGINCGSACAASFAWGTSVWLTPTPAPGSTFAGWSGDCINTGTCIVTMDQPRTVTAIFNSDIPDQIFIHGFDAPQIQTQTIVWTAPFTNPEPVTYSLGGTATLTATLQVSGGAGGGVLTYTVDAGSTACSVAGNTLTVVAATHDVNGTSLAGGPTCSITANAAGNASYDPAPPITRSIAIRQAPQPVIFNPPNPLPSFDPNGTFTVQATRATTSSGQPLTFTSQTSSICTVTGSPTVNGNVFTQTIAMTSTRGLCGLRAAQSAGGNPNFATGQATGQLMIQPGLQSLIYQGPNQVVFASGQTFQVTITGGKSSQQVNVLAVPPTCAIAGAPTHTVLADGRRRVVATIAMNQSGTCSLLAEQQGDADYAPASQEFFINIVP